MGTKKFVMIFVALIILLTSCNLPSSNTPTVVGPDMIRTVAARTLDAISTQLSGNPETPRPQVTVSATLLSNQATVTPVQTTPQQTVTGTGTPIPCDRAAYVRDVTIPDGTFFLGSTGFVKSWEIKNIGTCTWDSTYTIAPASEGNSIKGPSAQALISDGTVAPGASVVISIPLVAPAAKGDYKDYWVLQNPSGAVFFGTNKGFWVSIKVVPFDKRLYLMDNTCNAVWRNSTDLNQLPLPCPGKEGVPTGAVLKVDKPQFITGYSDDETAIQVEPEQANDGFVVGMFPPLLIPGNTFFHTVTGCAVKMNSCNARVVITGQVGDGTEEVLKDWIQKAADGLTVIDIDLVAAGMVGKSVTLRIYVRANGSPSQDRILILNPSIALKP